MRHGTILMAAFLLFLVSLPLLSFGTYHDRPTLWILGVACVVIGGLAPPILRLVRSDGDDDGPNGEEADAEPKREADEPERPRDSSDDGTHDLSVHEGDRRSYRRQTDPRGGRLERPAPL